MSVIPSDLHPLPDLGKELPLDIFQPVDGGLVSRRPELAAIIQPRLDQTSEEGKHETSAPPSECPESPASHTAARLNNHVYLDIKGEVNPDRSTL